MTRIVVNGRGIPTLARLGVGVAGLAPITAVALHVLGFAPLLHSFWALVLPLAGLVAWLVWRHPAALAEARKGWLSGVFAVFLFDVVRWSLEGAGPDYVVRLGSWLTSAQGMDAFAGYLWRYLGNGGGLGVALAMALAHLEVKAPSPLLGLSYGLGICSCLLLLISIAPEGQSLLFPLTMRPVVVAVAGHIVYGCALTLALGVLNRRAGLRLRPSRALFGAMAVFVIAAAPAEEARAQDACTASVVIDKELMITNPRVVGNVRANPDGPWHFATLVRGMLPAGSSDKDVSDFVKAWLGQWDTRQKLRAEPGSPERTLEKRAAIKTKVLDPWLQKSRQLRQQAGLPEDGSLRLDWAPFRLVAVVNRPDLRDPGQCRASAGEGRFVFGVLDAPTNKPATGTTDTQPFTVILEYALPTVTRTAVDWARAWHELSALRCDDTGCDAYLQRLEAVTTAYAGAGADPAKPFGNALNQLRTNEFLNSPWELREFQLKEGGSGKAELVNTPTMQTPDMGLSGGAELSTWVVEHKAEVLAGTHEVPARLLGFTGPMSGNSWELAANTGLPAGEREELRFQFSKNTCNGCHNMESDRIPVTGGFYHVSPEGDLSRFLTETDLPARRTEVCRLLAVSQCENEERSGQFAPLPSRRVH